MDIGTLEVGVLVPNGGLGMASQNDTYVDDKFSHVIDPKYGYLVRDCNLGCPEL